MFALPTTPRPPAERIAPVVVVVEGVVEDVEISPDAVMVTVVSVPVRVGEMDKTTEPVPVEVVVPVPPLRTGKGVPL